MGSTTRTTIVAALWLCVLQAQQRPPDPLSTSRREQQLLESLRDTTEQEREEKAKRRAAQYEFGLKWNKVVETMNDLAAALVDGKADLKKFKAADKALRELRADPGWMGK